MECLTQHHQRDEVEKCFVRIKKDLDVLPMNVKTESTIRGYLFMVFIALIIQMRLDTLMKENELLEKYSMEELLLELEKKTLLNYHLAKFCYRRLVRRIGKYWRFLTYAPKCTGVDDIITTFMIFPPDG